MRSFMPIDCYPLSLPWQQLTHLFLYRCTFSGHFISMESYTMWPFVSGFLYSA